MGGVSNSMAVVMLVGSPKTGGRLLTACIRPSPCVSTINQLSREEMYYRVASDISIRCAAPFKPRVLFDPQASLHLSSAHPAVAGAVVRGRRGCRLGVSRLGAGQHGLAALDQPPATTRTGCSWDRLGS